MVFQQLFGVLLQKALLLNRYLQQTKNSMNTQMLKTSKVEQEDGGLVQDTFSF